MAYSEDGNVVYSPLVCGVYLTGIKWKRHSMKGNQDACLKTKFSEQHRSLMGSKPNS